jgi:hypothetical protein
MSAQQPPTLTTSSQDDTGIDISPISPADRRNSLEKHLQTRPEEQDLKNRHILLDTNAAPSLQAKALELERQRATDNLKKGLGKRPERGELVDREFSLFVSSFCRFILRLSKALEITPTALASRAPRPSDGLESVAFDFLCIGLSPCVSCSALLPFKDLQCPRYRWFMGCFFFSRQAMSTFARRPYNKPTHKRLHNRHAPSKPLT